MWHQAPTLAHILTICMSSKAPGDIIVNEHAAALLERLPVERRSERKKKTKKNPEKKLFLQEKRKPMALAALAATAKKNPRGSDFMPRTVHAGSMPRGSRRFFGDVVSSTGWASWAGLAGCAGWAGWLGWLGSIVPTSPGCRNY